MKNGKNSLYFLSIAIGVLFVGINVTQAVFYTYPSISAPSGQNPNGQVLVGSSTGLYAPQATSTLFQNASATLSGLLTSTDWNIFNNKVSSSSLSQIFPFTPTTFGSTAANSTSTLIGFTNGMYSLASSTIGGGTQTTGLTINGGATTTGNLLVSNAGVGSLASLHVGENGSNPVAIFDTNTESNLFYITRLGSTDQALSIGVTDGVVNLESIQDENSGSDGGITFKIDDDGTASPSFIFGAKSGAEYARIAETGNFTVDGNTLYLDATNNRIGIGTSTPAKKLELAVASGDGISLGDRGVDGNLYIGRTGANAFGGNSGWINFGEGSTNNENFIAFSTNSSLAQGEQMRLSDGRLGIGTTSPFARLSIAGVSGATTPLIAISTTTAGATSTPFLIASNGDVSINNGADLTVNGGTLFADGTLNRVGIGDLTPNASLEIAATATDAVNLFDISGTYTASASLISNIIDLSPVLNFGVVGSTQAVRINPSVSLTAGLTSFINVNTTPTLSSGSDTITTMRVNNSAVTLGASFTGSVTSLQAYRIADITNSGTGTVINQAGITIEPLTGAYHNTLLFMGNANLQAGDYGILSMTDMPNVFQASTTDTTVAPLVLRSQRAAIVSGNSLGNLFFASNDTQLLASTTVNVAGIGAVAAGTHSGANQQTDLIFTTTATGGTATNTEKMRINGVGNVGINQTTPENMLHISTTSAGIVTNGLLLQNRSSTLGTGVSLNFISSATSFSDNRYNSITSVNTDGSNGQALTFSTSNSAAPAERMRISAAGNVGIGTTTPSNLLNIVSTANSGGGAVIRDAWTTGGGGGTLELIGTRNDSNFSPLFNGGIYIASYRSDAAFDGANNTTFDNLGQLAFGANHTSGALSNLLYTASISGIAESSFTGSSAMATALVFRTGSTGKAKAVVNDEIGTERMRITSSGKVGIGTSNPAKELTLRTGTFRLDNSDFAALTTGTFFDASLGASSGNTYASLQVFNSGGSTGGILALNPTAGNVGIGTTSPGQKLSVAGDILGNRIIGSYFTSTSTTATSTFAGAVQIGSRSNTPYLLVGSTTPNYGYFSNDLVDVYDKRNDELAINIGNGASGTCASASFIANGNIPGALTDFFQIGFANTGWTGLGCSLGNKTGVRPEDGFLYNPTGSVTVILGSTTPFSTSNVGFRILGAGTAPSNEVFVVTNGGNVGIGTTSPFSKLSVHAKNGETNTSLFSIASSTASATSTFMYVNNKGQFVVNSNFGLAYASSTASAASYTVDWNTGTAQRFILNQNASFIINSTSSNPIDGARYTLKICQDTSGSRTATFVTPGQLNWSSGTTTVSSTASTGTLIGMIYDARTARYDVVASSTLPTGSCLP